jgi:hypothetical protein
MLFVHAPSLYQTLSEGIYDLMRFHAKYVSTSEPGDYCQVSFDTEDPVENSTDPRGQDRPYLIIQRQFETLDGGNAMLRHMTTAMSVTSTSD